MKSEGSLAQIDIADLVQELGRAGFTGRLRLQRDEERVILTAQDGRLVFASSSDPDHRLGPRLLRRGAITLRQMEDATKAMTPGKRFGTILVELGFLAPKDLVSGVVDQTRDIILHAFRWTTGDYQLQEGKAPGEEITLKMSTPQLILDGISQLDAWSRIERGCGGLGTRYARVRDSEALFNQLTLEVDQTVLLQSVTDVADVESLCAGSLLSHFEVCRNLWAFRVIGLVRRAEATLPLDEDGLEFVLPADGGS